MNIHKLKIATVSLCIIMGLSLTACFDSKTIESVPVASGKAVNWTNPEKENILLIVDRVAQTHGFHRYDRSSIVLGFSTPKPTLNDPIYLASYRNLLQGSPAILHVTLRRSDGLPTIYIQGNDSVSELLNETSKDVLRVLQKNFPTLVFKVRSNQTPEFF